MQRGMDTLETSENEALRQRARDLLNSRREELKGQVESLLKEHKIKLEHAKEQLLKEYHESYVQEQGDSNQTGPSMEALLKQERSGNNQ